MRVRICCSVGLLAVVFLQACSTSRFVAETAREMQERSGGSADPTRLGFEPVPTESQTPIVVVSAEEGEASWYGSGAQGRRTASGEIFDRNAMTAAHRTLAMGSLVRVTNLNNGRQIVLRINDRGPWGEGRVIDVSERAAELLGFKRAGLAPVRVELIEMAGGPAQSAAAARVGGS